MSGRRTFLFAFLAACALLKAALESIAVAEAHTEEDSVAGVLFTVQSDPKATCDFCSLTVTKGALLVASPNAEEVRVWQAHSPKLGWVIRNHLNICNNCVQLGTEILAEMESPPPSYSPDPGDTLCCTFCGATRFSGRHLLVGGEAFICDLCVGLCNEALS